MRGQRGGGAVAGLCVATVSLGAWIAVAQAEFFQVGNLILRVDGGIKPTKLPKKDRVPVALKIETTIKTEDGSVPPILDRFVLDFDREGAIDSKGLPRCDSRKLQNTTSRQALNQCRKALVGEGVASAVVDFPDQDPFVAEGRLLAFNGPPRGGNPVVILHVLADVPLPTTFVIPAATSEAPGKRYGIRITTSIPPIAGGNGAFRSFDLTIDRTWRHKGELHGFANARCPIGSLLARGKFDFRDGSAASGSIVRTCTPKG